MFPQIFFFYTLGHGNIDANSHGRLLSHFTATPEFHSTSSLCTAPTEKVLSFPNLYKRKVTDTHPSAHTHTDILFGKPLGTPPPTPQKYRKTVAEMRRGAF